MPVLREQSVCRQLGQRLAHHGAADREVGGKPILGDPDAAKQPLDSQLAFQFGIHPHPGWGHGNGGCLKHERRHVGRIDLGLPRPSHEVPLALYAREQALVHQQVECLADTEAADICLLYTSDAADE